LRGRLPHRWCGLSHPLNDIRICQRAPARSTRASTAGASTFAAASPSSSATAATARNLKQRCLVEINRQRLSITVGNRAAAIGKRGVVNRSARLELAWLLNADASYDPVVYR